MHPYLSRLGIRCEVQEYFAPFYKSDEQGNLVFDYGDAVEHYGFAFHRVPVSELCWMAGNKEFNLVSRVFICSSAMEAIAFYQFKYSVYPYPENLLFLSIGTRPAGCQLRWISENLQGRAFQLVFGNSLLDKVGELVTAAAFSKLPLDVTINTAEVTIYFRLKRYVIPVTTFSVNALEKLSGYRFPVRSARTKNSDSYFSQLKSIAFNH